MLIVQEYFIQNWGLLLVSLAFLVSLRTTAFLDKTASGRMYRLLFFVVVLSLVVFAEFYLDEHGILWKGRPFLMAFRYSATPFIIAQILHTWVKKLKWTIFIPAVLLAVLCFISIPTGIIFSLAGDGITLVRGPLGMLPFIVPGLYGAALVYMLCIRSNRQPAELFHIAYLSLALLVGVLLPFVFGKIYSRIFCKTIVIALFIYYLFSILNLTRTDSLTGLLNRRACYASLNEDPDQVTALVSIDMNGLKHINDTRGHTAGDDALSTLAFCFLKAARSGQTVCRVGGDEFLVICRRSTEEDVHQLMERIRKNVSETEYSCAIGCSCRENKEKSIDDMLKESDEMMYAEKARYYRTAGIDRRHR